ncbi:G-type lectin S-receptor-like serine/threonine-protein kinase At1g67520 isoform X2 [Ipomoea triloba]|uniref:G-type lectin S-receptor-like serine/threonine-protein kinase At1g67520 isoform X2 n=1 Tax=Ipomoea triloba TaxID=35885 RepID=UPI00125D9D7C|nr:G-type lectin S-receptor-like serine/threonine-protein kinase At1g67520 isoform X2 [Ipomoea triloba]
MKLLAMEVLLFLLILCSMASVASSQTDSMKQGDVLNSSESTFLVSAGETFTLGFFTPERINMTYLAIWFTERFEGESEKPIWIGNREAPLPSNSSAKLLIDASGRLILTHSEKQGNPYPVSSKRTSRNVSATLQDSGELVLREINADGSSGQELWSSFDSPTDTLLPGMKLGVNHRTGGKWSLRSWQNDNSPAAGAFSLEWEPIKRRVVIKHRGVTHWSSGELKNATHFQHLFFHYGFLKVSFLNISTKTEDYFTISAKLNRSEIPREMQAGMDYRVVALRLDPRGLVYDPNNGPAIIDAGDCYGYENKTQQSKGCEIWEQPACRGGGGQTFQERSGFFFNYSNSGLAGAVPLGYTEEDSTASPSDCREKCWKDCDCVGYQRFDDGCTYWRGTSLQFQQDNSGKTVALYVLNRPIKEGNESSSNSKKWKWILIPIVIIATIVIVLLGLLQLRRRRRKREEIRKEQHLKDLFTLEEYTDIQELSNDEFFQGSNLKHFSYEWIVVATNNFSPVHKLGQGGFGSVYKGVTPEGQEVAIKQLSESSKQGLVEFKNEVVLIAKLQHTNLVKLLGFCIHENQKMLIYEFMPNKSLDFFLFDPNRKEQLTWEKRLSIIEGIAQGLLYLHKYSRVRIIHRDMKAGNILLDENMNPKISDFGMAKILKQNLTNANTMRLSGTFGYMAPEYAMEGIFSTKSDVYSFGVLVLEIISGKKNRYFRSEDGPLNLVEHAWELWNKDAALQIVDPALSNMCGKEEQLQRCINLGLLCVEDLAVDRPSMSDVISMLTNENLALTKPKKPAFVSRYGVVHGFQEDRSEKVTVNQLSISAMEAR